jgi:hypothetical protein
LQNTAISTILSLARSGATNLAWAAFVAAGLDRAKDDSSALTLKGRLLKDLAGQSSGIQRQVYFAQSRDAYSVAATLCPTDSYPLINAATMALFAGDGPQALLIAKQALALIEDGIDPGETPYWREATRAEALLLSGELVAAKAAMDFAIHRAPMAWEDRAVTLRQLRLICAARTEDTEWLAAYAPPPCLHYSGMIGIDSQDTVASQAITDAIIKIAPGFGFGALAAGADILIAEALVATGAALHLTLPCAVAEFRMRSVSPFGSAWGPRFDALLSAADSLYIVEQGAPLSDAAIALSSEVAMGAALDFAARYETEAVSLRVPAKEKKTASDLWISAARPTVLLPLETSSTIQTTSLDPAQRVCYLATCGSTESALSLGCLKSWQERDVSIQAFADIDIALSHLLKVHSCDIQAAIDLRITVMEMEDAHQRERIARMAKAAFAGTVIMGKSAAMLTEFTPNSGRIEPLGEIASSDGAIEIYAFHYAALS